VQGGARALAPVRRNGRSRCSVTLPASSTRKECLLKDGAGAGDARLIYERAVRTGAASSTCTVDIDADAKVGLHKCFLAARV
jgi:hypothetical protein